MSCVTRGAAVRSLRRIAVEVAEAEGLSRDP